MPSKDVTKVPALLRKVGQVGDTRPFYSPIDKAIAEITQTKATGDQMLAALLKTKGVAKELKDRPAIKKALEQPKITKQELEKVAAEHPAPQVEEKVLSGQSFDERHPKLPTDGTLELVENPETFGFEKYPYGVVDKKTGDVIAYGNDKEDAILDAYSGHPQFWGQDVKYAQYTIPHGENYREVLLKIPSRRPSIKNMSREEYNAAVAKADQEGIQDYQTSHFEEPNILAHARVSDRTGPNGEKILHVEEIQSDWHQKARDIRNRKIKDLMKSQGIDKATASKMVPEEYGYSAPKEHIHAKAYDEYVKNLMQRYQDRIANTYAPNETDPLKKSLQIPVSLRNERDPEKIAESIGELDKLQDMFALMYQERTAANKSVPDAPFKQNWHELVMKRLLDDAARNGYDKVVITPGKMQIDRYTDALRANLDSIEYEPYLEDGKQMFELAGYKNGKQIFSEEAVAPERMRELLGKSMHEKIMQGHGESLSEERPMRPDWKRITGDDISVGGEGMKGFYDQILPSYLNTYGKPYGARVGAYQMPDVETPLHSFDITPQMREDIVNKGQSLYQVAPVGIGAGAAMQEEPTEYADGGSVEQGVIPKMLSTVNRYLPLPTNAKVYIDSVIDQRKDPITNKDFSESELDIIRDLVNASTKPHQLNKNRTLQPTLGYVNYDTYHKPLATEPSFMGMTFAPDASMTSMLDPKSRVATTLGQFTYGLNPEGDIEVRDKYNFNAFGGNRQSKGTVYQNYSPINKAAAAINSMGYLPARAYGQEVLPEGSGRQVNLVIPKERFGEGYNELVEMLKATQANKAKGGSVSKDAMFMAVMNKKLKGKKNA